MLLFLTYALTAATAVVWCPMVSSWVCQLKYFDLEVTGNDIVIRMTDVNDHCQSHGALNNKTVFDIYVCQESVGDLDGSSFMCKHVNQCVGIICIKMIMLPRNMCTSESESGCIIDILMSSETVHPIPCFKINPNMYEENSFIIPGNL